MRKDLLKYDDVMNQQREVVYSLRLFALEGVEVVEVDEEPGGGRAVGRAWARPGACRPPRGAGAKSSRPLPP